MPQGLWFKGSPGARRCRDAAVTTEHPVTVTGNVTRNQLLESARIDEWSDGAAFWIPFFIVLLTSFRRPDSRPARTRKVR
jgi:hypothetical protein